MLQEAKRGEMNKSISPSLMHTVVDNSQDNLRLARNAVVSKRKTCVVGLEEALGIKRRQRQD
jgi:hypothetical protein